MFCFITGKKQREEITHIALLLLPWLDEKLYLILWFKLYYYYSEFKASPYWTFFVQYDIVINWEIYRFDVKFFPSFSFVSHCKMHKYDILVEAQFLGIGICD